MTAHVASSQGSFASRYDSEALLTYASAILEHANVPPLDAKVVASNLVLAELRGVDSHGLIRLPVYTRRLHSNVVNANPVISVTRPFAATALVDGDNGLGAVVGLRAMEVAMELAKGTGIGIAGVRRSNHFGVGAFYVEKAVSAGFIACAISNAPPNMAPFGGRERFLGTNPFAIGIPAASPPHLIFDASSSVAARGKIIAAAKANQPIPPGWALDPSGIPTTDPHEALLGAVLPFGGAKGSAISFLIDVLSGVLTGAAFGPRLNTLENLNALQDVGHVMIAIRRDLFITTEEFDGRIKELFAMLTASPPVPGVERVLLPGEPELRAEAQNREIGIALGKEVVEELMDLGNRVGVIFPPKKSCV